MPVFGKSFTRSYSVLDEFGEVVAFDDITSARIYDHSPSEAEINDSDGTAENSHIQIKTSWSDGTATNEKVVSFDALVDSDPHSNSDQTYYEVLSFTLESGGATKFIWNPLTVVRPNSVESRLSITAADIEETEDSIYNAAGTGIKALTWVTKRFNRAVKLVIQDLERSGILREDLREEDCDQLVLYKLTELCCLSMMSESGDVWDSKTGHYGELYSERFTKDNIGVDLDRDNHVAPIEKKVFGPIRSVR